MVEATAAARAAFTSVAFMVFLLGAIWSKA
jgi:hypothetical protein